MIRIGIISGGIIAIFLGLAAVAGFHGAEAKTERLEAKADDFTLTIATEKPTITLGEAPVITATLTNKSGRPVTLVPALDGSSHALRSPYVTFEIMPPEGVPEPGFRGRCGNTNNIQLEDFVAVADGGTMDPMGNWLRLWEGEFTGPGEYIIKLHYDTGGNAKSWFGFMGPLKSKSAIRKRLQDVPRMSLTSNQVTLRVVAPDKTP